MIDIKTFADSSGAYLEFVEESASVNFADGFIKPVIFSKYARVIGGKTKSTNIVFIFTLFSTCYNKIIQNEKYTKV